MAVTCGGCSHHFTTAAQLRNHVSQRDGTACSSLFASYLQPSASSDDTTSDSSDSADFDGDTDLEDVLPCNREAIMPDELWKRAQSEDDAVSNEGSVKTEPARSMQDGYFAELNHVPYITAYPEPAGVPLKGSWKTRYSKWQERCGDSPYYPFRTSSDWQIAKWVKLEAISQTAVNKLLTPELVHQLGLSFRNCTELNNIIDNKLPFKGLSWTKTEIQIEGTDEKCVFWHRCVMDAVRCLYGDPRFNQILHYAPEQHFVDPAKKFRRFSEMWTGNWWWRMQKRLPAGATIVPLIFGSDKTLLTRMSGDRYGYPVYMTIGNLPKATRKALSQRAAVLIGYLPTNKLDNLGLSEEGTRSARQRLFHHCIGHLLKETIPYARHGIELVSGDGKMRQCHPILGAWMADYPEQCLVTCTRFLRCPIGSIDRRDMGDELDGTEALNTIKGKHDCASRCQNVTVNLLRGKINTTSADRDLVSAEMEGSIDAVDTSFGVDFSEGSLINAVGPLASAPRKTFAVGEDGVQLPHHTATHTRKGKLRSWAVVTRALSLTAVPEPFFADLPHCQIHTSMYPDILHQLLQGMIKHVVGWLTDIMGKAEIDRCFKALPPTHGARLFKDGIAHLSQITGQEHKDMARVLLGAIAGSPALKTKGDAGSRVTLATRGLLDFYYLASMKIHSAKTVVLLRKALQLFHANKKGFVELGARKIKEGEEGDAGNWFCLPKLHMLWHYMWSIYEAGTLDNWDTQLTERLHITLAKMPFRESSRKKESATQEMAIVVQRHESLMAFEAFVAWRTRTTETNVGSEREILTHPEVPCCLLTKMPHFPCLPIDQIVNLAGWGCPDFIGALHNFAARYRGSTTSHTPVANPPALSFNHVLAWNKVTFSKPSVNGEEYGLPGVQKLSAHACCDRDKDIRRLTRDHVARFDTVLVRGKLQRRTNIESFHVARLRLVFQLPKEAGSSVFTQEMLHERLAYVEWFSQPSLSTDASRMPITERLRRANGRPVASIIELRQVTRNCMLQPVDSSSASSALDGVLDKYDKFYLNPYLDQEMFMLAHSRL